MFTSPSTVVCSTGLRDNPIDAVIWDLLSFFYGEGVVAEHPIYSISLYILLKSPSLWLVDFLNIIKTVLYIGNVLPLQWAQLTKTVHTARLGLEFVFIGFLGCMIYLYVGVCFVLPWTVDSFPFMFWRWLNKLK